VPVFADPNDTSSRRCERLRDTEAAPVPSAICAFKISSDCGLFLGAGGQKRQQAEEQLRE